MFGLRQFVISLSFLAAMSPAQSWACGAPLSAPASAPRSSWSELENLNADQLLNPLIQRVQTIKGMGQGKINTDYYAITVNKQVETAAKLMQTIRAAMSDFIFQGSDYSLSAYDAANAVKWKSGSPKGAVMSFTLARIPNVMDLERGSVVTSCSSDQGFIFSTVVTAKDGLHPVAGNRAFGVHDPGDGSLVIFTKAADRVVNEGVFAPLPEAGRELIFTEGHKVWLRLLDNLQVKLATRNPRNRVVYSKRRDY